MYKKILSKKVKLNNTKKVSESTKKSTLFVVT